MKKNVFSEFRMLFTALLLGSILSTPNLTYAIPDGDLTGDGTATISDALRALQISVQLVAPNSQDLAQGDVAPQIGGLPSPDGSITVADALLILRKVVGLVNWPSDLSALLTGDQQVPPVITNATAIGTVSVDPVTKIISGGIVTSGIIGIAAHIHDSANDIVVIPLTGGPTIWSIPDGRVLTDAELAKLLAGQLYFNVHSAANPNGEIRGDINQQVRFASLNGANEVPPLPVPSTATGTGVVALNPATLQVTGFIKTSGIVGTAAHIHMGAADVAGGVAVPLNETPVGSGLWTIPANALPLTSAQAALFNIGSLYYNVHSAANPGGEIRGQLVPTTLTVGSAALNGAQEVPPVTTVATGSGTAILNGVTLEVRGDLANNVAAVTAVQVQQGAIGVNGPIATTLTETTLGSGIWFIPDTTPSLTQGEATAFTASGLYYNVLSANNPAGEIRGQIIPTDSFKTGGGIATAAPL